MRRALRRALMRALLLLTVIPVSTNVERSEGFLANALRGTCQYSVLALLPRAGVRASSQARLPSICKLRILLSGCYWLQMLQLSCVGMGLGRRGEKGRLSEIAVDIATPSLQ